MGTSKVTGKLFFEMVACGSNNLFANKSIVNDLNVFPIPDGDTGDNMFMTINSGVGAVSGADGKTLSEVAAGVAKGMLLGARGNSGVILSRIFAGISAGLKGADDADVDLFAAAMRSGIDESYGAVSVPVEGTILTVYRDAVEYANSRVTPSCALEDYFADLVGELRASLDRTPELLAVLKEAGVVDSGGAGFVYIAEGMQDALLGKKAAHAVSEASPAAKAVDISLFDENSVLEFGYCTEFLLRLQNAKTDIENFDIDGFTAYLNSVGNSVVAFRDGSIVKVHVHTMDPGQVLSYCRRYGEFLTVKIENMTLQHNETTVQNRYEAKKPMRHKKYGIVTVAAGDGIKDTFSALGCDAVVDGGQSMNPSAEDFIRAFDGINADTILVFPNNGNIIMTAKQAASLYEKASVAVVDTRSIGEGYVAISMLDLNCDTADEIVEQAKEAIDGVVTATVCRASRDTEKDGVSVKSGDFIGFSDDDVIYSDSPSAADALTELAEKLDAGDRDIIMIISGKDAKESDVADIYSKLTAKYKYAEVIMIDGGQPIYDYMMILE